MSDELSIREVEVQRLNPQPGEVLIFTVPKDTNQHWVRRLATCLGKLLPHNRFLIVEGDLKITVATEEKADGREA